MVISGKVLPYEIVDVDDRLICKTSSLREAHRKAIFHAAATGYETSVWQGERRILTYFGWRPTRHNRRMTDSPQTLNRRQDDPK